MKDYQILTNREKEILRRISEDRSNKEMAAELGISIRTIENHRTKIKEKLKARGTAALTKWAVLFKLTRVESVITTIEK